jgi:hypothetical protein
MCRLRAMRRRRANRLFRLQVSDAQSPRWCLNPRFPSTAASSELTSCQDSVPCKLAPLWRVISKYNALSSQSTCLSLVQTSTELFRGTSRVKLSRGRIAYVTWIRGRGCDRAQPDILRGFGLPVLLRFGFCRRLRLNGRRSRCLCSGADLRPRPCC